MNSIRSSRGHQHHDGDAGALDESVTRVALEDAPEPQAVYREHNYDFGDNVCVNGNHLRGIVA